ncbi:MAG TPA: FAD-binding oxidoreductase [Candidatus Binatia bacterium]|jgi:alkyldihydroxyacetonephosphate synthase
MKSQFQEEIVRKIAKIVGPEYVSTDGNRLDELSWDALSESRLHPAKRPEVTVPLCSVLPGSTSEVRQIVLMANEGKVPIVPYGGGSGLMGGALSVRSSVVVDLRRMNQIHEIDLQARSARAAAGTVLEALERRLNQEHFMLGHDPWTLPVATLGGAISTNSMGYRGGLYGSMGDQILGLEAVLPDGEVLRTRAVPKSSAGIDLKSLLIGGEGCFGIITEATIRIFPAPEKRVLHGLRFESFEIGYNAIQELFRQRLQPAVLDFGDADAKFQGGAVLYLAFEGIAEVVEAEEKRALAVCQQFGAQGLPHEDAERFWNDRHEIARRFMQNRRQRRERGRDGIYRDWIHVALPASKVLSFRAAATEVVKKHGVRILESGLWIQPELFSMPLGIKDDGLNRAQLALEETVDELLHLVHKLGGSMEYTHGVGVKLAPLMADEHGYGLEVMRRIKHTLDPNGIMNPGKMGL